MRELVYCHHGIKAKSGHEFESPWKYSPRHSIAHVCTNCGLADAAAEVDSDEQEAEFKEGKVGWDLDPK